MTSTWEYPDKLNLENCVGEPINIISHTQAQGVLVACDPKILRSLRWRRIHDYLDHLRADNPEQKENLDKFKDANKNQKIGKDEDDTKT